MNLLLYRTISEAKVKIKCMLIGCQSDAFVRRMRVPIDYYIWSYTGCRFFSLGS